MLSLGCALRGLACALGGVLWACGSDDERYPPLISGGGGAGQGGQTSAGAGGRGGSVNNVGGTMGPTGGSAGSNGGDSNLAGTAGFPEAGGTTNQGPAVCKPQSTWQSGEAVPGVTTSSAERLLSLTPDERTLLFLREGTLYLATRSEPTSAFSTLTPITLPSGYTASEGAALSPDALRLVIISTEKDRVAELTRESSATEFGQTAKEERFQAINGTLHQTKRLIAAPLISASGKRFFFASFIKEGASFVMESTLAEDNRFSVGTGIEELAASGPSARRLPTGISSDERTLFYFDESSGKEEARFRDGLVSPFYERVDLGDRRDAQPNSTCTRLYFSKAGDVVHAAQ